MFSKSYLGFQVLRTAQKLRANALCVISLSLRLAPMKRITSPFHTIQNLVPLQVLHCVSGAPQ